MSKYEDFFDFGKINWQTYTTNVTATSNSGILVDTSAGVAFTVTLPATPNPGDFVVVRDGGNNLTTTNVTISGNGNTINGSTTYAMNVSGSYKSFTWLGNEWRAEEVSRGGSTSIGIGEIVEMASGLESPNFVEIDKANETHVDLTQYPDLNNVITNNGTKPAPLAAIQTDTLTTATTNANNGIRSAFDSTGTRFVFSDFDSTLSRTASVYIRTGETWTKEADLTYTTATIDLYYTAYCDITAAGDRIVLGGTTSGNIGVCSIFVRSGSTWTLEAKIQATTPAAGDGFAVYGVAIDGTGTRIAIEQGNTGTHIYVRSGTTWTLEQSISTVGTYSRISLDSSGTRFLKKGTGTQALIYTRNGTTWTLEQGITVQTTSAAYATMNKNGDTITIASKIYRRTGTTWSLVADLFGESILDLDDTGDYVLAYSTNSQIGLNVFSLYRYQNGTYRKINDYISSWNGTTHLDLSGDAGHFYASYSGLTTPLMFKFQPNTLTLKDVSATNFGFSKYMRIQ